MRKWVSSRKNISLKLICAITVCSLTAAMAAGGITLKRSSDYLTHEIEGKLLNAAENYAHYFSATFNHTEGLVDSFITMVSVTFDRERFHEDPIPYMDEYKLFLSEILEETLKETHISHGLFVTFDPELTPQNDEVWFTYQDGEVLPVLVDFEQNRRNFKEPVSDDMLYYFLPLWEGDGVWLSPYFDKDIKLNVLTYSKPIFADDLFLGVGGADITTEETTDIISRMKEYDGGYAFLLDEDLDFIIHPGYTAGDNFSSIENGALSHAAEQIAGSQSGLCYYTLKGQSRITSFCHLDNGWILAITQPLAEALHPIYTLNNVMFLIGITLLFFIIAFAILFSIVFFRPISQKQDTLEAQNREKEVLLAYQSKQAKVGEMVGNIAHQWKQPLNSINLILINLLDAYQYGELDEDKLNKSVQKVRHISQKLSGTFADFTEFLKPTKEKAFFDVNESVEMALSLLEESINYNKIQIRFTPAGPQTAYGYANEFAHVLYNILDNARDAIVESNPPRKQILLETVPCKEGLLLKITNSGAPIPDDTLPRIFEPYFTTKESRKGTGIGLYISKQIIERMRGDISLYNTKDGVCCAILLPVRPEQTAPEESAGDKEGALNHD